MSRKSSWLKIEPESGLTFTLRENEASISQMRLHNPHEFPVAFKVKLTHRFRYNVRPCVAIVDPESVADVHVEMISEEVNSLLEQARDSGMPVPQKDKFMVACLALESEDMAAIGNADELQQAWDTADDAAVSKKKIKSVLVFPELRQHGIATGGTDPQTVPADAAAPAAGGDSTAYDPAEEEGLNELQKYVRELERRLQLPVNAGVLERLGGRPGPAWVPRQDLASLQRELEEMKNVSVRHVTANEKLVRENGSLREEVERFQAQVREERERARAAAASLDRPEVRQRRQAGDKGAHGDGDGAGAAAADGKEPASTPAGQFALWHLLLVAVLCLVLGKLLL